MLRLKKYRLSQSMPQKTTDLAYLAGLIDGEGYIGIQQGRMWNRPHTTWRWRYKLVVVITMCAKPTIRWVHQHFGGKVYARSTGSMRALSALVPRLGSKSSPTILREQRRLKGVLQHLKTREYRV